MSPITIRRERKIGNCLVRWKKGYHNYYWKIGFNLEKIGSSLYGEINLFKGTLTVEWNRD